MGEAFTVDLAVAQIAGDIVGRSSPFLGDQPFVVVEVLQAQASTHGRYVFARLRPFEGFGVEDGISPTVDVEVVAGGYTHQIADRGQRQLVGQGPHQIHGLTASGVERLHELVHEAARETVQRCGHGPATAGCKCPGGEQPERGVPRLVHEHHVEWFVGVPAVEIVAASLRRPHPFLVFDRVQAEAAPAVDEGSGVPADGVDIVVASDRPERFDAGSVIPVHRRLPAQQLPLRPRVAPPLVQIERVNVDRVEISLGQHARSSPEHPGPMRAEG